MKNNKKTIGIKCTCGGNHAMFVEAWDSECFIVFLSADTHLSFFGRVKEACTFILFKNNYVYHDVIFEKEKMQELKKFINEIEI